MTALPTKALSIRQPWAWHILWSGKDVENRTWSTSFRGRVLIHASKAFDASDKLSILEKQCPLGGIVGVVEIVDCVTSMQSAWFCGPYGFVLRDARCVRFVPCQGKLGIFTVPDEILAQLGRRWDCDEPL